MFLVEVVCSDPECAEEREIAVDDLDQLENVACECGHGFVLTSVSELDERARSVSVIPLRSWRGSSTRRAA